MTELLLANAKKDINSNLRSDSTFSSSSFVYDGVYDTIRYTNPKSCYKKPLLRILAKLYRHQIAIIIVSFIIGFITFALPLIFIYIELVDIGAELLLIICAFGLFISLIFIIIPCIDSKKYKYMLSQKVERNNIKNNIGNIFLFILISISVVFAIFFYNDIMEDKDSKIKFDYNNRYNSQELLSDFIFKYILYIFLMENDKIEEIKNIKIRMIFEDWDIDNLRKRLTAICIPLLIISFFSVVKIFLIEIRQTVEKAILFGGIFILLFFQCYINSLEISNLKVKKVKFASLFQSIVIIIILFGYIFYNVNYSLLFIKKRRNKNFAIRKLKKYILFLVTLIDIITCMGYCIITIAILYCYIIFNFKKDETFSYLNISLTILKIGFFPVVLGNSYYFGYYFLCMIFRPLATEYAPYELKNEHYIKAKRQLANFLIMKARKEKMRETIKNNIN